MASPIPERLRAELKRKALHLALLIVIPLGRAAGEGREMWVPLCGLCLSLVLEVMRRVRAGPALWFYRLFRASIRRPERRGLLGVTPFFVVISAMAAVASWPAVEIVIAVVLVGDAAAALVGRSLRPGGRGRTWQGTVAYVLAGSIAARALGGPPSAAVALAVTAAAAERLAGALHLDDNWVAPPLTLVVALLLGLGTFG